MSKTHWLAATSSLALLFCTPGCVELDCGEGTVERDGTCVPADSVPDPSTCAGGTHLEDGECVPDLDPTTCGANTEIVPDPDNPGSFICVGTGGGDCSQPIVCPTPEAGRVSVCGRLINAEDNTVLADASGGTGACNPDSPTMDGPCSLELQFYEALDFAEDPTGTTPFNAQVVVDQCGRFSGTGIPAPALGFLAVGADDYTGSGDDYVLGGVALPASGGLRETGLDLIVTHRDTDAAWSMSAGEPFGAGVTFSDVGVFMPYFVTNENNATPDTPVAGVTIVDAGGTRPNDDYYFSDADPTMRTTVDVNLTATGVNGTGLLVNSASLENHGGQGPAGCTWPENLAASIANVVFVQEKIAVEDTCP